MMRQPPHAPAKIRRNSKIPEDVATALNAPHALGDGCNARHRQRGGGLRCFYDAGEAMGSLQKRCRASIGARRKLANGIWMKRESGAVVVEHGFDVLPDYLYHQIAHRAPVTRSLLVRRANLQFRLHLRTRRLPRWRGSIRVPATVVNRPGIVSEEDAD